MAEEITVHKAHPKGVPLFFDNKSGEDYER